MTTTMRTRAFPIDFGKEEPCHEGHATVYHEHQDG
jgi:hypothetical protein